jgi:hypothetical protein
MGIAQMFTGESVPADQWKPVDTGRNRVVVQQDCGGVAAMKEPHQVPHHLIGKLSFTGSLNECLRHDGREDQEIASAIHISKGYLSKLLRSVWQAQAKRLVAFMRETQCIAPLQWMAHQMGVAIQESEEARIRRLEHELAQAKTRRTA